jgi:prepilin peptidase CpaA
MTLYDGLLTVVCLGLLAGAAMHDIAARTIPNVLPAVLAGAGAALRVASGDLPAALAVAAVVFLVAALCWLRGWLGGGDVKLLGAASLAVPAAGVPGFVLGVGLAGGGLALLYLLSGKLLRGAAVSPPRMSLAGRVWRAECWRMRRGGPLPYAVAIAAAGALALLHGAPT